MPSLLQYVIRPDQGARESEYDMVPTNEQLEANAPDTIREAVKYWLLRHVRPTVWDRWTDDDLDWAVDNFLNDPEIRGAHWKEFGK